MLFIHFGDLRFGAKEVITMPSGYFDNTFEEEWFDDPLVKRMVLDVDKSEVFSAYSIKSPVLGAMSCEKLSGGVKNLILAYKLDDVIIDASFCGDNCAKWLLEIGNIKDLFITLYHPLNFYPLLGDIDMPFMTRILNNSTKTITYRDYLNAAVTFLS